MFSYLGFKSNLMKFSFMKFFMSMIIVLLMMILYFYMNYLILFNSSTYNMTSYTLKMNFLGYSLLMTGVLVGFFIFFLSDSSIFFKNTLTIFIFILFFILIWFFINETSYMNLFFMYELFLLPSFYLVYSISPNSSSMPISIYFLTWTQFGSIFILLAIMYLYISTQSIYLIFSKNINYNFLFLLLFMGFGMKMPMWPFYYWLTKTHVEASSFFSIYLSGFLVKTAVYLFNHFYTFYYNVNYMNFLFIMMLIGMIDSSMKMWHQVDLKKLIAYTTVQEMNLLFMPLLWNNEFTEMLVAIFMIVHCLLSSLFFFMIDILLKSFNTSIVSKMSGLLHMMPLFTFFMFMSLMLFCGLPFTSKFYMEMLIFNLLMHHNMNIFMIMFFMANWVGIIGFSKNMFNILFGAPMSNNMVYDLTKKELLIFMFMMNLLFFMTYLSNLFF